ncbi:uncharacterized protein SAPINGB_P000262 [Magnusiomyces paraingens]|uniref:Uncharacterized protein n=1 Tax=Magnusiomyces paraingens TaxID=2606893 RepID=A0A5E8B552_9ASCO|nr:uncharacterized protein SAPINGB_P000262 [Saprochaete ingens]VVT44020.1 unnamed protein product [Saprochaete ingens]
MLSRRRPAVSALSIDAVRWVYIPRVPRKKPARQVVIDKPAKLAVSKALGLDADVPSSKDLFTTPTGAPTPSSFTPEGLMNQILPVIPSTEIQNTTQHASTKTAGYVTAATPFAPRDSDIRGVLALVMRHCFALRFLNTTPRLHHCDLFTVWYFPPWHVLALGRKSRPAFVPLFGPGSEFNGDAETLAKAERKELLQRRSKNPMLYAHARKYMGRLGRRALWQSFNGAKPTDRVDGLYLFRFHKFPWPNPLVPKNTSEPTTQTTGITMSRFPETLGPPFADIEDYPSDADITTLVASEHYTRFDREMDKVVTAAAKLAKSPMPWVDKFNNRVDLSSLNEQILRNKLYRPLQPAPVGSMIR